MAFDKKYIIIKESLGLFLKYGVQHITMDDIANKCGVSKKTIYKYFNDKSDLLCQVMKLKANELKKMMAIKQQSNTNALKELCGFFDIMNTTVTGMSPTFIMELKKHHSTIFLELLKYKSKTILPFLIQNIEKGKREGLYKIDLNTEEICQAFDDLSRIIFFNGFNNSINTIKFLNSLFLHRLVSSKGLEIFNEFNRNKMI
ncbi:MAG: TetR/AcrR family transcriptional regulator [Zunongwangia sp.]|uniref:TetR/AcrR family transcriptional regulator n=1 Tax=Zunongwangia sp. TaxID=1965325 RepID=UPI0032425510